MRTAIARKYHRRFRLLPMLVVAAFGVTAAAAPAKGTGAETPPEHSEAWYVVKIRGQKCGYVHETIRTVGKEVLSDSDTQISINRGNVTVKMKMERSYRETLDGRPLAFHAVQTLGAMPQTIDGVIEDGKIRLTSAQPGGAEHKSEYDFDPDCLFSWGQLLANRKHGLKPGTKYDIKTYDPSVRMDGPITMGVLIHGKEKIDVLGESKELHRVTSSMEMPGNNMTIDSDIWVDDDYFPVVTTVDIGPIQMKMYLTTKKAALAEGAPPEMFLDTIISANRDVSRDAKEIRYRIALRGGAKNKLPDLPNTDMQTFERIDDHSGYVTVRHTDWASLREATSDKKALPDAVKKYLEASSVCDSSYRKIKRLAIRASKADDKPATRADKMRKYVTRYISNKGMDIGFATATEVAENRGGDCTEHAVLLAAVARASGIPARGVGGLVGVPSSFRRNSAGPMDFGFHMWTQVYIDGKWVDIDAAMRQTDCDATHIAIALIPLGEGDLMGEVWGIVPMLGQLDIDIVDVKK